MIRNLQIATAVAIALFLALFASGPVVAQGSKAKEEQRNITKLELTISKDGRSIVDQNGKIVARFVKGTRVQMAKDKSIQMTTKDTSVKLQGCMCCVPECVIYEGSRCVQWMRSCTWDFDCSCR